MSIDELIGLTLVDCGRTDDEEIFFVSDEGYRYSLFHSQDCCESVRIEDINGDLATLVGFPITLADESRNSEDPPLDGSDDSYTWTFYRLATAKGYVDIRWFGSSNGYYSESVDFVRDAKRILGPFHFEQSWLSGTVLDLARTIKGEKDFSLLPILGDALQDAGCDNLEIIRHCMRGGAHHPTCRVIEAVL